MKLRNSIILLLSLATALSACHNKSAVNNTKPPSIFDDTLYKFINYQGLLNDTLLKFYGDQMPKLDSSAEKKVLDNFYPFESASWSMTSIAYVAKQHTAGNIQPVILRIDADDYGALVLVTFNTQKEVIDRFALSGGLCAGPEKSDTFFLTDCPNTHSIIIDSSHIEFYKLTAQYPFLHTVSSDSLSTMLYSEGYDSIPVIDSLRYILEIKPNGKIVSTFLDSVRIDMHKKTSNP